MPLSILFVTSEIHPLIKTGGLADVSAALPAAQRALGADARVLVPGYRQVLARLPQARPVAWFDHPYVTGQVELRQAHLPGRDVPLYIVVWDAYFNRDGGPYQAPDGRDWPDNAFRFGLLSHAAALLASNANLLPDWRPHILHCNDWQTGLAPAYLHYLGGVPTVMTIHNLAYQGNFDAGLLEPLRLPPESFSLHGLEYYGHLSFLKAGLYYADWLTTVSPTYAREIQHETLGFGMHGLLWARRERLTGILNGIDVREWDPAHDPHLPAPFSADHLEGKQVCKRVLQERLGLAAQANRPLLAVISRITYQKGSDVVLAITPEILRLGAQVAVLGAGETELETALRALATRYPGQLSVTIGFDEGLSHLMEAGADIFLMPSRYEPCGLNQMYSQRYGTPPVVHATGGLADTVVDANPENLAAGTATGFIFHDMHYATVLEGVRRALDAWQERPVWRRIQQAGMRMDFSWEKSARAYLDLYQRLLAR
ncbi:glycogen synthase GlgA [Thiobacter aerophilum]|uniref:Glycogen synthase n=1 Tax=Thiobacter aerophilum TaxID=3121275 RepID=A0ABV0EI19_9BURK